MNRWLAIILILVTAMQSLVAIGDTHQAHDSAMPHHDYEHTHFDRALNSATLEMEESFTSPDPSRDHESDHCHQNHAHFHIVFVSATTDIAVLSSDQHLSDYQLSDLSIILSLIHI